MEGVVPHPQVAPILQDHFVGLAADADADDQDVIQLAMKLEGAMMLPFVIFTDEQGEFLDGYSGTTTPPYFLKTIQKLTGLST